MHEQLEDEGVKMTTKAWTKQYCFSSMNELEEVEIWQAQQGGGEIQGRRYANDNQSRLDYWYGQKIITDV